jgi:multidrug efflux pump subunit AcrB
MYHHWLPEGTDIRDTSADMKKIEEFVLAREGVANVSTFVGGGATRFLLTYTPEDSNSAYGLLLIDVDDYRIIDDLARTLYSHVTENFPHAMPLVDKFALGPGQAFKIQARFSGPDDVTLRDLSNQALAIFREYGQCQGVSSSWREQVKVVAPQFSEAQARRTGITRPQLAAYLEGAFSGTRVGVYREQNKLIPIISRPPAAERLDVENINDIQIWSPAAERAIPLGQVVSGFDTEWQDGIIARRDRKRTITVRCTPMIGDLASEVLNRVKNRTEEIPLPQGFALEWGGDYEDSQRAVGYIMGGIPVPATLMIFILVLLFNSLRQPAVILLTVPLSVIGVAVGLILTNEPFGFMALLGFLSLSGMLIKNAIVLIDEINAQLGEGKDTLMAIMDSGVSRLRPVAMAAATTVLGMIPLFSDPFYIGMAVTIVGGLTFATVLTLVVVPVLYATLYRVPYRPYGTPMPEEQAKGRTPSQTTPKGANA